VNQVFGLVEDLRLAATWVENFVKAKCLFEGLAAGDRVAVSLKLAGTNVRKGGFRIFAACWYHSAQDSDVAPVFLELVHELPSESLLVSNYFQ
jgi:hypothetical protein